ncbi:7804_t:CDS:2, partial [Dentiscutata heterogama]
VGYREFSALSSRRITEKPSTVSKRKNRISPQISVQTCRFQEVHFKFEPNNNSKDPDKYHAQGYAELRKQARLGNWDSKTQTGTGIKLYFRANLHIHRADGTKEECLAYLGKDYERCKNPKHQPCKCDYNNFNHRCERCDETCIHLSARISDDPNISTMKDCIEGTMTKDEIIMLHASNNPHWVSSNPNHIDRVVKARDNIENQKISFKRCWKPCNIFIFGKPRTGKSYLLDILFPKAYKKTVEDKWWPGFNEHDEVIINEFDGSFMKWLDLLDFLDRGEYDVQFKGGHANYAPKIQAFTSNIPLRELYTYAEDQERIRDSKGEWKPNRKYYSSIIGRFDYVIEYQKICDDSEKICIDQCACCKIMRIFHKSSREKFNNNQFDIEFNNYEGKKTNIIVYPDIIEKLNLS